MMLIIDPPAGWRYGFPRPLPLEVNPELLDDWLLSMGYPKKLIDQGMSRYCRYWEEPDDSI